MQPFSTLRLTYLHISIRISHKSPKNPAEFLTRARPASGGYLMELFSILCRYTGGNTVCGNNVRLQITCAHCEHRHHNRRNYWKSSLVINALGDKQLGSFQHPARPEVICKISRWNLIEVGQFSYHASCKSNYANSGLTGESMDIECWKMFVSAHTGCFSTVENELKRFENNN